MLRSRGTYSLKTHINITWNGYVRLQYGNSKYTNQVYWRIPDTLIHVSKYKSRIKPMSQLRHGFFKLNLPLDNMAVNW